MLHTPRIHRISHRITAVRITPFFPDRIIPGSADRVRRITATVHRRPRLRLRITATADGVLLPAADF